MTIICNVKIDEIHIHDELKDRALCVQRPMIFPGTVYRKQALSSYPVVKHHWQIEEIPITWYWLMNHLELGIWRIGPVLFTRLESSISRKSRKTALPITSNANSSEISQEPLKQFRPAVYKNLTQSNIFPNNRLGLPEDGSPHLLPWQGVRWPAPFNHRITHDLDFRYTARIPIKYNQIIQMPVIWIQNWSPEIWFSCLNPTYHVDDHDNHAWNLHFWRLNLMI